MILGDLGECEVNLLRRDARPPDQISLRLRNNAAIRMSWEFPALPGWQWKFDISVWRASLIRRGRGGMDCP